MITNVEAHMVYRNIYSPKKKQKESNSSDKRRWITILEVHLRKSELYIPNLLDVFHSRLAKPVLKRRVQFCLIASLIARVHGEMHSLSERS